MPVPERHRLECLLLLLLSSPPLEIVTLPACLSCGLFQAGHRVETNKQKKAENKVIIPR